LPGLVSGHGRADRAVDGVLRDTEVAERVVQMLRERQADGAFSGHAAQAALTLIADPIGSATT
jgi:hypothetical protein